MQIFADCLISEMNRSAGCAETAIFDRGERSVSGFRLP
jgi:predicted nucleic-acid-binding protein